MSERQGVRVNVLNKSIYGSIVDENKYDNDTVTSVIEWLQKVLEEVPEEYRATAKVEVESVGGWEGEHHAEISVHYERPETNDEMATRAARRRRGLEDDHRRHAALAEAAAARLRAISD